MLNKLSATKKGLLTGIAMIAVALLSLLVQKQFVGKQQYIIYALYAAGVIWTLVSFHKNNQERPTFKAYFNEGFKCFIVVTLLMVVFTFVFFKVDHNYQDAVANLMREDLLQKGNTTPAEIDSQVASMRNNFAILHTGGAIFFYLFIGLLVTAATSAYITRNKN